MFDVRAVAKQKENNKVKIGTERTGEGGRDKAGDGRDDESHWRKEKRLAQR